MPISSISNGQVYLPAAARDGRARLPIAGFDERRADEVTRGGEASLADTEAGVAAQERRAVNPLGPLDGQRFRAAPSFESQSNAQSNALRSYLSTQNIGSSTAPVGSELIVGVDVFV